MENTDYKYYKNILDKLVNDYYSIVRMEVAYQGYGIDKLVNDEDENVRKAVMLQGYGLDKLVDDIDEDIRGGLTEENKQIIQGMPNFSKEIFFYITGIRL